MQGFDSSIFNNGWDAGAGEDGLALLAKALEAGSGADAGSFTGGRALIPESLDTTLVSVLWDQNEAKFFKSLKRNPIKGPVHQWNERTDVGDEDGAWVDEGGTSFEKDQTIARKFVESKYLQTKRQVTLQMMASNSLEQAEAIEKNAGTLWLVKQTERGMFHGNKAIVSQQFDGLEVLVPATNVIDLRGSDLISNEKGEDAFAEGARIIRDAFGMVSDIHMSTHMMEDTQKLLRDRLRVPAAKGTGEGAAGAYVYKVYPTPFGSMVLEDNLFIRKHNEALRASSITAQRPDQVSIALVRQAVTGSRVSQFVTADAGAYWIQVVAVNKYGDSVASTAVQVSSVVLGDEIKITITDGSIVGTGYKVYRSKLDATDGSDCRYMFEAPVTAGAGEILYDVNADLPNTTKLFMVNNNPAYNAIEWEQWLPMMKFQLYPTNAAINPFLMLLFGAMGLKKPTQQVIIKNVSYSRDKWL